MLNEKLLRHISDTGELLGLMVYDNTFILPYDQAIDTLERISISIIDNL